MAIIITLDEETSARVAGMPLAEITRYAHEGILSHLPTSGYGVIIKENEPVMETVPASEPWDEETIIAVRDSMREVEETGITYSLDEVEAHVLAKIDAWEKARRLK